ncbi:metallo-beta-lactamase superfamily protein [Xylogone sp. PMI_703]|nr:metallo-beta-lactamase superfamily protein [Xylogone sp. PMI_703]
MSGDIGEKPEIGALTFPPSNSTVEVRIINTTTNIVCPTDFFLEPPIRGQELLNFPTFAFLIENKTLKKAALFDLGGRKDWWNLSPSVQASIRNGVSGLEVTKNISEILEEEGYDLKDINSLILSHSHWDHLGNPSLFSKNSEVVVGPGFKKEFLPGYPTNLDSFLLDTDFDGRPLREIEFDDEHHIGKFRSYDFFGDGSLYLLDVPGHSVGHICALARTTPDTFIFMGGDVCHYAAAFRPTEKHPLPKTINPNQLPASRVPTPCSSCLFTAFHPRDENAHTSPFYNITKKKGSWYTDYVTAQKSVDALREFDDSDSVFVAIAHDVGLIPVVEQFPRYMNRWKELGWKEKGYWGFLSELPVGGKAVEPYAPGLMREGKIVS